MSCKGRNMEGAGAPCFLLLFTTKLHVQRVIFGMLSQTWNYLQFTVASPVGGGNAFTFAPALRHGRHTDIDAAASTRNFGACAFMEDSCNACPALFAGDARPHVVRSRRAGAKARA